MISVGCFCGSGFPRLALLFGRILEKFSVYIYTYVFLYAVNAALDFVIPISSTSLPGGNLVDGLPPAASSVHSFCSLTIFPEGLSEMMSACKARALDEGGMMNSL